MKEMLQKLREASVDAILQADVRFSALAFCVCDEQHRFGVAQRNELLSLIHI